MREAGTEGENGDCESAFNFASRKKRRRTEICCCSILPPLSLHFFLFHSFALAWLLLLPFLFAGFLLLHALAFGYRFSRTSTLIRMHFIYFALLLIFATMHFGFLFNLKHAMLQQYRRHFSRLSPIGCDFFVNKLRFLVTTKAPESEKTRTRRRTPTKQPFASARNNKFDEKEDMGNSAGNFSLKIAVFWRE